MDSSTIHTADECRPELGRGAAIAALAEAGLCALLLAAAMLVPCARAGDELESYVRLPDPSYAVHTIRSGRIGRAKYVEAVLSSQTWHGTLWKHQLFVISPQRLEAPATRAVLFIDGGSWNPAYEDPVGQSLPRAAGVFVRLADALHAPVAIVRQIPFEPLFDGRREDALIAYTFERYLDDGEADWPLLLPMVKGASRAMDAVQQLAREQWGLSLAQFTVTGASKRGWTTWLTAAVDPRVAAIAPMVIAMLNMRAQIQLQEQTFGGLSASIDDFARIDLPQRIDTPAGRELVSIVDPYSYRDRLTQPKLVLLGTNDPYWPLDALNEYWSGLEGEKRVLYLPNQGHELRDIDRLIGSLAALHRYTEHGRQLPQVTEAFREQNGRMQLAVRSDAHPRRVLAWSASSRTRDFRDARWSSHGCPRGSDDAFDCEEPSARDHYTAVYAEAQFQDPDEPGFSLSTTVHLTPPLQTNTNQ